MESDGLPWQTTREAARYMKISERKLVYLTAAGLVQSLKRDGARRYLPIWNDAYLLGVVPPAIVDGHQPGDSYSYGVKRKPPKRRRRRQEPD